MKRYVYIKNIGRLVTMTDKGEGELGVITDAACFIKSGKIEWIGKQTDAPLIEEYQMQVVDANGGLVMPGLVDCHTHLVHGGSRQGEVAERARGISYEDIAKAGGGILSTVKSTRKTDFETLCEQALKRADEALEKGVTTMEVKSGYGLDTETEIKMLKVVDWLEKNHPITFIPTFLGAHAIPKEFKENRDAYIDLIIDEMIPKVADEQLAKFCDVFVEKIAFSIEEARKVIEKAKSCGLVPKLHVDQMTAGGGAELAASVGAVSAGHLEYVSDEGIKAMANAGVIAVIMPGSTFYLGQENFVQARKFIEAGITVAIATDYNPGTTPSLDIFLIATMAMSHSKMTMEECLKGITINGARSLQLEDGTGQIRENGVADLIVLDAPDEYFPIYRYSANLINFVVKSGRVKYSRYDS